MPERVLGLDILPRGKGSKKFAAVVLSSEGIVIERRKIERRDLIGYISKKDINSVAIDNIWEISEETREIKEFLKKTQVNLVQVTGRPGNLKKLSYLAKKHNLHSGNKLSPMQTAEVAARLFLMDEGARISAIKDQTKISVVRSRSLGSGGQRQAGFERSISSMLQNVVRDLKQTLNKNRFTFDFFARKKKHGIQSGRFLVYEPYKKVKQVIKELETDEVRVEIEPIERNRLTFLEPEEQFRTRRLFCGVDPGRTVGLALLNLHGNVIETYSKTGIRIGQLIDEVYRRGKPILIATDVSEVPNFVEQMRRKCALKKTEIFHPKKDISTAEKWEIIRELGADVNNTHERDALVAAFMAFMHYKEHFKKIDKILSYLPVPVEDGEVKERVVGGETIAMSISKVLSRKLKTKKAEKKAKSVSLKLVKMKEERDNLLSEVAELRKDKEELRSWISELEGKVKRQEKRIQDLEWKVDEERRKRKHLTREKIEAELEKTKSERLKRLERAKRHLKRTILALNDHLEAKKQEVGLLRKLLFKKETEVAVKSLTSFKKDEVQKLMEKYGVKRGEVLWVRNPSGAGTLPSSLPLNKIKAIITEGDLPLRAKKALEEAEIPLLIPRDFPSSLSDDSKILLLPEKDLETAIENKKLRTLPEKEKRFKMLEKSIEEYRKKRQV
ncbi:MAG: DUF460 domain-containing protein [Candidatus Korarchaeota archaeon]|nr:DUF460 domain-containing protein [Candidatus Korarchaeota archaeon]NIU85507.1 DUF460 domain-containing protein [Candidatus Thorarchaeota archaeon]NIW15624.1 DUF460 domain-containing protein [Candidatus Thorarchaeota archaeon]NIW53555.1 DUF460 domain-containing protein [Candidatus Korarchaeota archaeon]